MAQNDELLVRIISSDEAERLIKDCHELFQDVLVDERNVEDCAFLSESKDSSVFICVLEPPLFENNDEELIVGGCKLHLNSPFLLLEKVAVKKAWRKQYVGSLLCRHAIKLAEQKYSRYLLLTKALESTYDFFEKLGFVSISDTFAESDTLEKTMIYFPHVNRINNLLIWEETDNHHLAHGEFFSANTLTMVRQFLRSVQDFSRPRFLHFQHSFDRKVIGSSLVRTYRECALALKNGNTKRSQKLEEFLFAVAWEKLNTGHYSLVDDAWRELYSAVSTCRGLRLFEQGCYKDALRAADFGLMMGGDIDNQSLSFFANMIHSSIPSPMPITCERSTSPYPVSLPNSRAVKRISRPSMEEFLEYFVRGEPVVITDVVAEWPAFKNWNFEYFNKIAGHRMVPVEIGSSYASDEWRQTFMTLHEYIKEFIEKKSTKGLGYLAQHRMFEQIPELLRDLILPDYYAFSSMDDVDLMIWIGPGGTVSPLHTDPKSNIFCQVYGRKFFRMVSYAETDCIYRNTEGLLTNTSQMDVENPDYTKFPLFASAHVYDCVVEAGDCLFIPSQFWHHVRSLDPSISISCWFQTQFDFIKED